ncbi:MAG: Crp/Fnr family transcriptional regulator [Paludibacteraceae bacterium]|nr:Crp/Fnr family transcriptional regulator [Paludibacteraceae bacterium]
MPNIIQENAHFLDNDPLWAALTAEERQTVQKESTIVRYGKNEQIYREEDIPEAVMLLVSGKVRIYKEGIGQRPQIIRMLKPNELFAYRAVIAGDGFNTSASAFEDSVVYRLPKDTFLRIIRNNSEFCFRMMVIMAKNLAFSELQTVNLTQKHIRGRLAESLLTLKNKYGVDDDGVTISMYMSREDLANLSNMTTSNAIRTLSQFASEGIVGIDGRKIKLLNEPALTRISRLG